MILKHCSLPTAPDSPLTVTPLVRRVHSIVIASAFVSVRPLLVTSTSKFVVPAVVGVPLISPVPVASARPYGPVIELASWHEARLETLDQIEEAFGALGLDTDASQARARADSLRAARSPSGTTYRIIVFPTPYPSYTTYLHSGKSFRMMASIDFD